ncbi:hypothetical protein N7447_010949 [Penicillium robsamsonii]|uniref:uncharacterized protein n=1 Tax=Penicillium robsamsonii TaxID=1792511 RepID=UPI0025496E99|nr:uncharacterized protein N7447_010949 [Penicillium robsamsonii]KAJ5807493.1 hypothetical protein N7447_010949 [Penicillium robsamsonii]
MIAGLSQCEEVKQRGLIHESGKEGGKKMSAQKRTGSISQARDGLIKARCAACIILPPSV